MYINSNIFNNNIIRLYKKKIKSYQLIIIEIITTARQSTNNSSNAIKLNFKLWCVPGKNRNLQSIIDLTEYIVLPIKQKHITSAVKSLTFSDTAISVCNAKKEEIAASIILERAQEAKKKIKSW